MTMPVWHEQLRPLVQKHGDSLVTLGIVQEQHADRARLFMQWKQMDWPILVDSLNLLGVDRVPLTYLIDENGIVREINAKPADAKAFVAGAASESDESAEIFSSSDLDVLRERARSGVPDDLLAFADALVMFGESEDHALDQAIGMYQRVLDSDLTKPAVHFRIGVAYRQRYESDPRHHRGDFARAVEQWQLALDAKLNQYIWRRRIQQYGPRLDKPYPFYDWVRKAREEIIARGETPIDIAFEPTGAEIAHPAMEMEIENASAPVNPDPDDEIYRDTKPLIEIDVVNVASTDSRRPNARRIHLLLTPDPDVHGHWNNENEPVKIWIEDTADDGLVVDRRLHTVANELTEATSAEARSVEFEVMVDPAAEPSKRILNGYALYYVCEGADGTCMYLRQDFTIQVK